MSSSSECSFETHSQGDGEGRKNKWKSCLEHSKFNNNLLCSEPMFCTNFILFSLMLLYLLLSFGDKPFGFVFKRNTQFVCLVLLRAPLQFHYRSVLGTFFPVHFGELNFVQIVSVFHQKTRCNAVQLEPDWSKENDEGVPRPAHDLWFNFSCTKILPKNIKPTSPHSWASSILSVYYSYEQTTPREREYANSQVPRMVMHSTIHEWILELRYFSVLFPLRIGWGRECEYKIVWFRLHRSVCLFGLQHCHHFRVWNVPGRQLLNGFSFCFVSFAFVWRFWCCTVFVCFVLSEKKGMEKVHQTCN